MSSRTAESSFSFLVIKTKTIAPSQAPVAFVITSMTEANRPGTNNCENSIPKLSRIPKPKVCIQNRSLFFLLLSLKRNPMVKNKIILVIISLKLVDHVMWISSGLRNVNKIHDEMLNHTGDQSISPGKAIGFLFIPIFNIFWVFYISFHVPGLIKNMDMNDDVPMGSQTNAGMIGIIGLVPVVNLLWAPLIQNALNRHWRRHANETR